MVKVLDCDLEEAEFELWSCCYVFFQTNAFGKGMDPFIPPGISYIVLLMFYENGFGFEYPTKVAMSLNKETFF